ncbi:hypothetical protein HDU93_010024, partial [Gonapodya sp. JEL0774]
MPRIKSKNLLLAALALLTVVLPIVRGFSLTHKVLILTVTPSDSTVELPVTMTLDAYGIPYEVVVVPSTGIAGNLPLVDSSGNPKYSLIVIAQASLNYASLSWASALTASQWTYLEQYEATYNVRRVTLDDLPQAAHGTATSGGSSDAHTITLNSTFATAAGLNTSPQITVAGLWHYPATITNTTLAKPVVYFEPLAPTWPSQTVGAVVITYDNGRQQMAFYTPFG